MNTTLPRLPGVYFLPPAQPATLALPRLDVAAFVGFAQRGPLHTPVAVEDVDTYRALFGGDVALARDREPALPAASIVRAHLPEAVAAFFRNGGRRCFVVRVAGSDASSARLRVPGLVGLDAAGNPRLASLRAGSAGTWSERLRLASRLRATPLPARVFTAQPDGSLLWQTGSAPQALQVGDLLRLVSVDGEEWLFPVTAQAASSDPDAPTTVTLRSSRAFQLLRSLAAPVSVTAISRLTLDGAEPLAVDAAEIAPDANGLVLHVRGADAEGVAAGDALRLTLAGGDPALLAVAESRSLGENRAELRAASLLALPGQPLPASLPALAQIDRLRFDQLLWLGATRLPAIDEVALGAGHPRFWGEVAVAQSSLLRGAKANGQGVEAAEIARLYRQILSERRNEPGAAAAIPTERSGDPTAQALAALLAPVDEALAGLTYLPLGMAAVATEADVVGPTELGSDGLLSFGSGLFVDPTLVPNPAIQPRSGSGLEADAFNRYYVQNRRLRGIHSLLFLPEVALVAVPDAVHRPWGTELVPPDPPPPEPPPTPPDWTSFQGCPVDEAAPPGQPPAVPPDEALLLPLLDPIASYDSQALLDVQHALVNLCQARRDVVAVLGLPLHFEKRQCVEWQETLRQRLGLPRQRSAFDGVTDFVDLSYLAVYHPWLVVGEEAGFYTLQTGFDTAQTPTQPTATGPTGQVLRVTPPDGAVCGMIAARERQRQVWVAPANVPLQGVLDLLPAMSVDDWADLFAEQLNLIRREPDDFRAMSAHTLSEERQLLQLSVRRLMILLRKVALERGMAWTFENNDERLRDAVRTTLEALLRFMFERGAFAGRTPQQAFRVVTDQRVNTRQSMDQGRFIAQVQVAPSQPMEFITVLLSRASDGVLLALEA